MRVVDHSGLPATALADLERATASLDTLADVILWGLAHTPARVIAEVIVQDEYTHDVVLPWTGERYLTFDTT